MKKKIKNSNIINLIIAILIVGLFTTIVVASVSKTNDIESLKGTGNSLLGKTEVLVNYRKHLAKLKSVYCIQYGKDLLEVEYYQISNYVEITGNEAKIYNDSSDVYQTLKSDYNAQVAYILGQNIGYTEDLEWDKPSHKASDAQEALWYLQTEWTNELFGEDNPYSFNGNATRFKNSINEDAEKYADSITDMDSATGTDKITVTDKTNTSNIVVMEQGSNFRIGPFCWEFDGVLEEIIVTGDRGKISNPTFVVYEGSTAKTISDVADITTGQKFYIDISQGSGISKLTGLTLKASSGPDEKVKVYKAGVWFLTAAINQNVIFVETSEEEVEPVDGQGSASYGIDLALSVGLTKVDDRDGTTPLRNVGFTFKATIQTYDKVGEVEHKKPVACTHVATNGYTDDDGVWHDPTYQHSGHLVYDWTQNLYEWKDHTMYLQGSTWAELEGGTPYVHKTNSSGKISINNMTFPVKTATNETYNGESKEYVGRLKGSITATEVSNPYYGYADNIGKTYTVAVNTNNQLSNTIAKNHQDLVKISGYVWLDGNADKQTVRNDLRDYGEKGINNIQVYLKNTSGYIVKSTKTSELGIYSEINGGEYRFVDVDLDALQSGSYYIEYEYCGITYQSVAKNLNRTNGSKAIDTTTRRILDAKFTSVNSTGTQTLSINGVTVNYNGIQNYVSSIKDHKGCTVYARTNEAGYNLYSGFSPTMEEIRYVNLGLFEKAQTDFALAQDLYDVRIDVNGFSHIYRYASVRYNSNGATVNSSNSWNVGVKFQTNTGTYNRAIYASDTTYEASRHQTNEIRVYVTYKIALKNESSYLGRVNNIVDYCDNRYNLIAAGTSTNDSNVISGNLGYGSKMSYNSEYSKYIINVNTTLQPGQTKYVYAQFELNRQAVLAILNNEELLNNVAEINSYTTFKDNNTSTPVSVIDRDSVPGNAVPGVVSTYEDDTDAARSLRLQLEHQRSLSGTVFVDSTGKESATVYTGQERRGNGQFDGSDKTLPGVKVTLREVGKDDSSYDGERVEMQTVTDQNGNFKFVGYIPGNYVITYTWGDRTYKVQYYKGTVYDENRNQSDTYWYKVEPNTRKTDALDSNEIRTKIDDEMEALKYNTLEGEINKAYEGGSNYIKQTSMNSTTPVMSLSIEYQTIITSGLIDEVEFKVDNVDFGIVERPKQQLDLDKRVSKFKITLANGQILVDAEITEDGRLNGQHDNTIYIAPSRRDAKGLLRTEMSDEIIEGATLEVTYLMKVTNVGELDYVSDRYYYYGNKADSDSVRASVTELIDYVDGRLSMLDSKWEEKDKQYLDKVNANQKDNVVYINSTRTYMTTSLTKDLAPGETNTVDLYTSKLLTSTDDNTFENQAEIAEVTKKAGFNTGTPVKVTWSESKPHFDIDDSEKVIIIPNTGDNKGYVIPTIVGISTLLILSVGIVLIKKFVINKQ